MSLFTRMGENDFPYTIAHCSRQCSYTSMFALKDGGNICLCGDDFQSIDQTDKLLHQECGKCPSSICLGG